MNLNVKNMNISWLEKSYLGLNICVSKQWTKPRHCVQKKVEGEKGELGWWADCFLKSSLWLPMLLAVKIAQCDAKMVKNRKIKFQKTLPLIKNRILWSWKLLTCATLYLFMPFPLVLITLQCFNRKIAAPQLFFCINRLHAELVFISNENFADSPLHFRLQFFICQTSNLTGL